MSLKGVVWFLKPWAISSRMPCGGSLRGLSEVAITRSDLCAATEPIERPLRAVAVAAATEDGDDPLGIEGPQGVEEISQRVVGVGVVDDHCEGLARIDAFHAAGNAVEARNAARRLAAGERPSAIRAPMAPSRLLTLKRPTSGECTSGFAFGGDAAEANALERDLEFLRSDLGLRAHAEGPASRTPEQAGQDRPVVVVEVHDRLSLRVEVSR